MSHILCMRWFITLYRSVGYVVSVELTPLCHKQTRNEGPVSLFKVITSPPWLALTIFLPSSLLLFVAHWQCYLLPIITLSSWLHILIAVCTAFINHLSCSSIQPFSHQFTYFLIWCSGFFFSALFYYFLIIMFVVELLVFFPALLTNRRCVCFLAQSVSPTMERTAGVDRPLVKPTICRSVRLLCVYIRKVVVFVCLLMFLPYFLVMKLNYAVDEGPYRYI